MDRTISLKNTVEDSHANSIKRYTENYTIIKEMLSEMSIAKIEKLDTVKDKLMENLFSMEGYYESATRDIIEAQNTISDMKRNIDYLHKLPNTNKYNNLIETLEKNKKALQEHLTKYTNIQEYDKIVDLYQKNKSLVEHFRSFVYNDELLMLDIVTAIRKNQDSFNKNPNIRQVSKELGLDSNIKIVSTLRSISEVYCKAQENSNILIIYDIEKKKFFQIKTDKFFPLKSFSLYNDKSVYLSGGMVGNKIALNSFIKIEVNVEFDQFAFEYKDLKDMIYGHYSHTMVIYKDYIIAISGNTKHNEIYDAKQNTWHSLPDLPANSLNPALVIVNDQLYCFSGSVNSTSLDRIYKLSLLNINKILLEKGFEDILSWESIDYYYHNNIGRLRRGMAALSIGGSSIFLFGGFDADNIYDSILDFDIKKKDNNNNNIENSEDLFPITQIGLELPIKTFFNSNILLYDMYLVMIDGFNNALELDLKTQEFFYYT
jgi:hypothetical protein